MSNIGWISIAVDTCWCMMLESWKERGAFENTYLSGIVFFSTTLKWLLGNNCLVSHGAPLVQPSTSSLMPRKRNKIRKPNRIGKEEKKHIQTHSRNSLNLKSLLALHTTMRIEKCSQQQQQNSYGKSKELKQHWGGKLSACDIEVGLVRVGRLATHLPNSKLLLSNHFPNVLRC